MRRVIAISLAILIVAVAARSVMAKDVQQDGNNLRLKVLEKKISVLTKQVQELKGQQASQQNAVDQKLTALDRSMADYLAKAGDKANGNMSYVKGQGTTFTSSDGNWNVFFGGLFQFAYNYESGDSATPHGGFALENNRLDVGGTIFDPNLSFYVQADASSSWTLLDAYVDWKPCDFVSVKAGRFKVPYGRQSMVDESDRAMGLNPLYSRFRVNTDGRDTGVMLHNVVNMDSNNPNGMAFEWDAGLWNGSGDNATNDTWLAWGLRGGIYPMGYVDYKESDLNRSQDPKFGIAASVLEDQHHTQSPADNPKNTLWEVDGVLTWQGVYATAEYFSQKNDNGTNSYTDTGWYVQAGYMVTNQLEVLGRYGTWNQDSTNDDFDNWALGANWYFDGREWKIGGEIGQMIYSPSSQSGGTNQKNWFISLMLQADW